LFLIFAGYKCQHYYYYYCCDEVHWKYVLFNCLLKRTRKTSVSLCECPVNVTQNAWHCISFITGHLLLNNVKSIETDLLYNTYKQATNLPKTVRLTVSHWHDHVRDKQMDSMTVLIASGLLCHVVPDALCWLASDTHVLLRHVLEELQKTSMGRRNPSTRRVYVAIQLYWFKAP